MKKPTLFKATKINIRYTLYVALFIFVVSVSFLISSIFQNIHAPQNTLQAEQNHTQNKTQHNFTPNDIADDVHQLTPNTVNISPNPENITHILAYKNLAKLFDAQNLNSTLIPQNMQSTLNTQSTENLRQYQNIHSIQNKQDYLDIFSFNASEAHNPIDLLSQLIHEIYAPKENFLPSNTQKNGDTQTRKNKNEEEIFYLLHIAQDVNTGVTTTLNELNIPLKDILFLESAIRVDTALTPYPFIAIELYNQKNTNYFIDKSTRKEFIQILEKNISDNRQNTTNTNANKMRVQIVDEETFLYITYNNIISHIIRFQKRQDRVQTRNTLDQNKMQCTIIIDDFGENFTLARQFMDLPFPVVFSIWPQSTYSTKIATIAYEKGLPIFLHQPMQPRPINNYVPDMGKSGLTIDMTQEEMKSILQHNILSVPHLRGINNHMGSLFTSTPHAVESFLRALKSLMPQLLIIDSITHAQSCLFERAQNNQFLSKKRHYFFDNNEQNIAKELNNVYAHVKKYKEVYAIGHARKKTLEALQNWKAPQDKNLVFTLPTY